MTVSKHKDLIFAEKSGKPYCPRCSENHKQVLMAKAGYGISGTKYYRNYKCKCGYKILDYNDPKIEVEDVSLKS